MRTVSTKLSKDEVGRVKEVADKSKLKTQLDIVEDIYSFMKEPNIIHESDISEDLITEFAQGKFEYYLPMKKKVRGRIEFFNTLLSHPYYSKFKELPPLDASAVLLDILNAFVKKKEEEEKGGGGHEKEKDKYTKEFESLIKYGKELFDLLDDEFFKQLMEKNPNGNALGGKEPELKDLPKVVENIVNNMAKELAIYELSQKLEFTIRTSKTGKYNEVQFPDNGLDVDRIKHTREVTKALPSQFLDEDIFFKKLVSKELLKRKYMQRQEKRQVLYMMVDASGSMYDRVTDLLCKLDVCKAITIALMKKMIDNEDFFYFRWFDTKCLALTTIKTKKDALAFLPTIVYGKNPGGGTNIMEAVRVATKDIHDNKLEKMDVVDILLVTDGLAQIFVEQANSMLNTEMRKIDMHTVLVEDSCYTYEEEEVSPLIQISKNFLKTKAKKDSDFVEITNLFTK